MLDPNRRNPPNRQVSARRMGDRLRLVGAYARSMFTSRVNRTLFDGVEKYCMFIGYPRSGHSLVGSLLDAHPEAVVAHEMDALRFVRWGFGRDQLYQLLLENSREYARAGREQTGYAYEVPNQWQGRYRRLRVIGDKRGGSSSRRLASDAGLLGRLQKVVGGDIRYVHVVRNPYDNVATMYRRTLARDPAAKLSQVVANYLQRCETNDALKRRLGEGAVLDVRHEDLISDPTGTLRRLCAFFDLESDEKYLKDCASIVFRSPNKSRHAVEWDDESLARIRDATERLGFLDGYSYED